MMSQRGANGSGSAGRRARLDGVPTRGAGRRGATHARCAFSVRGGRALRGAHSPWYGAGPSACPGGGETLLLTPPRPGVYLPIAPSQGRATNRVERHGTGQSLRRGISARAATRARPSVVFARSRGPVPFALRYVERRHGSAGRPSSLLPLGLRPRGGGIVQLRLPHPHVWLDRCPAPPPPRPPPPPCPTAPADRPSRRPPPAGPCLPPRATAGHSGRRPRAFPPTVPRVLASVGARPARPGWSGSSPPWSRARSSPPPPMTPTAARDDVGVLLASVSGRRSA